MLPLPKHTFRRKLADFAKKHRGRPADARGAWTLYAMDTAKQANVGGDDVQFYDCNGDTFYPCSGCTWKCESNENGAEIANGNYVTISDAENGSVSHGKVVGVDGGTASVQINGGNTKKFPLPNLVRTPEPAMPLPARGANKKKFPLMQVFVNAVCRETLEQIDKRECATRHTAFGRHRLTPVRRD